MKLDLEYKDEKLSALSKEVEELTVGGGATDEEVAALKRNRNDLEMRLKDQVREIKMEIESFVSQIVIDCEFPRSRLSCTVCSTVNETRRPFFLDCESRRPYCTFPRNCFSKRIGLP